MPANRPDSATGVFAQCPSGKILIGGGFNYTPENANIRVISSIPDVNLNQWRVSATNPGTVTGSLNAHAVCVTGS
ncbi:hypothetical protein ABT160_39560 [Streptomyces sp. NPDC001941]|uniref:hypothetical protein n=1 Tax=Streptomyces sp. NPDC001941 TaxID=3154659 RepID=UPI003332CF52